MHVFMCVSACVYVCMSVCACVRGSLSVCYRLYAEEVYARMAPHQLPEILRLPLEQTVLQVRAMRQHPTHSCSRLTMLLCLSVCLFLSLCLSLCLSLSPSSQCGLGLFADQGPGAYVGAAAAGAGTASPFLPMQASRGLTRLDACVSVHLYTSVYVCVRVYVLLFESLSLSLALALSVY
jgi:hypothetical protein